VLALLTSFAFAADVSTFRTGQAVARHPDIRVYVDALDQEGTPLDALQQGQITATLSQVQVPVKEVICFDKSGEGVGYVFLVDVSKSLTNSQFDQMKGAINLWIETMGEKDRALVVSFGEKVTVVQDYTADKNALKNAVKTLVANDNKTQLHQGIAKAMELGRRIDANLPVRRVIVTLSDGEDDFPGGMTRDEVLASMKEDRVPLYAIGFSQKGQKGDVNLKKLGEFARISGGDFFDGNDADLSKLYDSIQQKILKSFLIKLDAAKAPADGKASRLQLTLNSNGKSITDGLDIRVMSQAAILPLPWYKKIPIWGYAVASAICLLIIILMVVSTSKKRARLAEEKLKAEAERKKREKAEQDAAIKRAADEGAKRALEEKQKQEQAAKDKEPLTVKKTAPPGLKMKLSVLGSTSDQREYGISLSSRASIGRGSECDLTITDDEEISKRHCELVLEGGYVLVNDLNSTNGTFVNGVTVKTGHRLKSGDLLMVGRTEMRIVF
jgi:VWFA-related protein